MRSRIVWFAAGVAASAWLRRISTRTGVNDEEAFASLPGDEVIRQPMVLWTRGVTVPAPAEAIWPWLVQAGPGRAGWYTPRWIDDIINPMLFRTRITDRRADDRPHPVFQHLDVGDVVADGPDYAAFFRVLDIQTTPPRWLSRSSRFAGLFDATHGVAMLRAIASRATAPAVDPHPSPGRGGRPLRGKVG